MAIFKAKGNFLLLLIFCVLDIDTEVAITSEAVHSFGLMSFDSRGILFPQFELPALILGTPELYCSSVNPRTIFFHSVANSITHQ